MSQALLVMCLDGESNCARGRIMYACTCARTRSIFVSDGERLAQRSTQRKDNFPCASISVHIAIVSLFAHIYHNMLVIEACDILNALQVILFRLMNYAYCYMYYLRHTSRVLLTSSIRVPIMIDSVTLVRTFLPSRHIVRSVSRISLQLLLASTTVTGL